MPPVAYQYIRAIFISEEELDLSEIVSVVGVKAYAFDHSEGDSIMFVRVLELHEIAQVELPSIVCN